MKTKVRVANPLPTKAKQHALGQVLRQVDSKPSLKPKTLPTRALGKPKLNVDFSSNASIQEMLDKELAVKPVFARK